jgi:hypothetical protein
MIALESGIAPSVLLEEDPAMIATMLDVLAERSRRG